MHHLLEWFRCLNRLGLKVFLTFLYFYQLDGPTETCIMSQFDLRAGTSADAFCSSAGRASVAPATTVSAVGAARAPGTADLLNPSRSVTTRCTPST